MSVLLNFRPGEVGTPEFAATMQALVQMANACQEAAQGGLRCVATPATAGSDKDDLNAAAAGTFKKTIVLELQNAAGERQTWFNGTATLTPFEQVADTDVAAPTVTGGNTVHFVDGRAVVELVYDTGEGKTYAAGDQVGFTTQVPAIWGGTVNVTGAGFTDTVVA